MTAAHLGGTKGIYHCLGKMNDNRAKEGSIRPIVSVTKDVIFNLVFLSQTPSFPMHRMSESPFVQIKSFWLTGTYCTDCNSVVGATYCCEKREGRETLGKGAL